MLDGACPSTTLSLSLALLIINHCAVAVCTYWGARVMITRSQDRVAFERVRRPCLPVNSSTDCRLSIAGFFSAQKCVCSRFSTFRVTVDEEDLSSGETLLSAQLLELERNGTHPTNTLIAPSALSASPGCSVGVDYNSAQLSSLLSRALSGGRRRGKGRERNSLLLLYWTARVLRHRLGSFVQYLSGRVPAKVSSCRTYGQRIQLPSSPCLRNSGFGHSPFC